MHDAAALFDVGAILEELLFISCAVISLMARSIPSLTIDLARGPRCLLTLGMPLAC